LFSKQKESQGALLLHIITKFTAAYRDTIDGKLSDVVHPSELYGGARINYIFQEVRNKKRKEKKKKKKPPSVF
jgi:hypothetical protein